MNTASAPPAVVKFFTFGVFVAAAIGLLILFGYLFGCVTWKSDALFSRNMTTAILVWVTAGAFAAWMPTRYWVFPLITVSIDAVIFGFAFLFRWLHRRHSKPIT